MGNTLDVGSKWYRLDNAAKIYPAISNAEESCVFRIAVNLAQDVIPKYLRQAVIDCKPRFPSIYVKLKNGLFWNYFEYNANEPVIKPETSYINQPIDLLKNNDYLFSVFYYKNRISIEIFHSLCDGSGAFEFLKAIVYRYFELLGYTLDSEGLVLTVDQTPDQAEIEDSFVKHYMRAHRGRCKVENAYRIQGTRFITKGDIGVINGKLQVEQLSNLVKKSHATLTQYLATLLTYCIWQADLAQVSGKPININITVNLRRLYHSRTLRNFSLFFYTSIACKNKLLSFESILEQIKEISRLEVNKNKLQQNLNANVAIEKNIAFRICPLFIKNTVLKIACKLLGDNLTTSTISNGGRVLLPNSMKDLVKDFECCMALRNNATHSICIILYNGQMTISFSRSIFETEIERLFFTYLADRGIDIEIQSNLRENFSKE